MVAHPPDAILEIAAGTGQVTQQLRLAFPGARITATDVSAERLRRARRANVLDACCERVEQRAHVAHVGHRLAGALRELFAELHGGVGIAFQHLLKQAARNPDHGRRLARHRCCRTLGLDQKRKLAHQGAGAGGDLLGRRRRRQCERAFLHHVTAVGLIAERKQRLAVVDIAALGADRENAQRRTSEQPQCRHPFQECDVVFNAQRRGLTAPACSRQRP